MSTACPTSAPTASDLLQAGQTWEAQGNATEAVAYYDRAITCLQENPNSDPSMHRELAIAWMNRGNALQKLTTREAVSAYDHAIRIFTALDSSGDPALTNSLGAAYLNRSHALQQLGDSHRIEATRSCEQAVSILGSLPLDTQLAARLNLAGAQLNLAHLIFASDDQGRCLRAHAATADALNLAAGHELERAAFAEIGLKARRILCEIIGQWLIETDDPSRQKQLIATASDAVDTGLTLARRWESLDATQFRPLAERLFRFGTAFYRRHQPQFLADFVLENLDRDHTSDAFQQHPEFREIAREALASTRHDLRTQFPVVANNPQSERRLQTLQAIESALVRLRHLTSLSDDVS